jgi:hypothetical protein
MARPAPRLRRQDGGQRLQRREGIARPRRAARSRKRALTTRRGANGRAFRHSWTAARPAARPRGGAARRAARRRAAPRPLASDPGAAAAARRPGRGEGPPCGTGSRCSGRSGHSRCACRTVLRPPPRALIARAPGPAAAGDPRARSTSSGGNPPVPEAAVTGARRGRGGGAAGARRGRGGGVGSVGGAGAARSAQSAPAAPGPHARASPPAAPLWCGKWASPPRPPHPGVAAGRRAVCVTARTDSRGPLPPPPRHAKHSSGTVGTAHGRPSRPRPCQQLARAPRGPSRSPRRHEVVGEPGGPLAA